MTNAMHVEDLATVTFAHDAKECGDVNARTAKACQDMLHGLHVIQMCFDRLKVESHDLWGYLGSPPNFRWSGFSESSDKEFAELMARVDKDLGAIGEAVSHVNDEVQEISQGQFCAFLPQAMRATVCGPAELAEIKRGAE